jgi:hypothetical protein
MSNLPNQIPIEEIMPGPAPLGVDLLPHIRKLPRVLYGIFVEVIRQYYMNFEGHPMGTPTKVWDKDPTKTEIWIDTEHRWVDDHPEFRPAIFVALSPITYESLTGRKDGAMNYDVKDSTEYFSRSGTGTVSFVHIGGTCGEALALADSTMDYLDAFGKVIRDDFCFTSFNLTGRVPLQQMPKESKERYGSTVTCSYQFQDRWSLKQEAQLLKIVTFRALQQLSASGIV